ncbi:MAG: hypothetical protein JNK33_01810 [Candidatus Doudnabacteria bacterium]|nr:hypothetical protein [Candidatus Doudnabacteria bacterium]
MEKGLQDTSIDGVIISASNVKPGDVATKIKAIRASSSTAEIYFDPEYYANFIDKADKYGKLSDYDYFLQPKALSGLASPKTLLNVTKTVLDLQAGWGLKKLISPSIEIPTFGSAHESYSLSLLNSSIEYVEDSFQDKELYGTILINENAFNDLSRMADFLDAITRLKGIKGFYIVADRTGSTRAFWDNPQNLAAYMYVINALTLNKKEVILGYCDGTALLGLAMGAKHAGVGWWQNSTNFTKKRFIKSGGRRRKQYYSKQLMNSIYVDGELSVLVDRGYADVIANSTKYDKDFSQDPLNEQWSDEQAILHRWAAMKATADLVMAELDTGSRLSKLETELKNARIIYRDVSSQLPGGFDIATGPSKVDVWLNAINIYRTGVL